jgi:prepilin-type N-terminal cleavage/methylation domain-containing protein
VKLARRARRRAQRGFTLLELLMTLTVTTIGLVGLMSLHLSIARGNDSASRFAEATQIANATLEGLRAQKLADMMTTLTGSPTSTPPTDVTRPTVAGRAGMTYRVRVLVTQLTSASSSLWRLRVEVGWTEDGAAEGDQGGLLDHLVAVELIRTVEEQL